MNFFCNKRANSSALPSDNKKRSDKPTVAVQTKISSLTEVYTAIDLRLDIAKSTIAGVSGN